MLFVNVAVIYLFFFFFLFICFIVLRIKLNSDNHLTHLSLLSPKETLANSVEPDQTPQNAASNQGLHCLHLIKEFL